MSRLPGLPWAKPIACALCLLGLAATACSKKEPKPERTEPWLAHPSAQPSASGDAAAPTTRYVLGADSVIRFEIPTKQGALSGSLTRVSGELDIDLSNLAQSKGWVRADLGSLDIRAKSGADGEATLLERARAALELSPDPGAPAAFARFDLTSVEDATPSLIEAPREPQRVERSAGRDAGTAAASSRRAHFTAIGDLLLHGFRVVRRAPLSAEFGFADDQREPHSVLIRSRAPFVISLETHAIVALAPDSRARAASSAPAQAREARVSVELYGTKVE